MLYESRRSRGKQRMPDACRQRLFGSALPRNIKNSAHMRNGNLAAAAVPRFVEQIPYADSGILRITCNEFFHHAEESLRSRGIVQNTVSDGTRIAPMRRVLPSAMISEVILLHTEMRRPVLCIFRHRAVVSETDHHRTVMLCRYGKKTLEPLRGKVSRSC